MLEWKIIQYMYVSGSLPVNSSNPVYCDGQQPWNLDYRIDLLTKNNIKIIIYDNQILCKNVYIINLGWVHKHECKLQCLDMRACQYTFLTLPIRKLDSRTNASCGPLYLKLVLYGSLNEAVQCSLKNVK